MTVPQIKRLHLKLMTITAAVVGTAITAAAMRELMSAQRVGALGFYGTCVER